MISPRPFYHASVRRVLVAALLAAGAFLAGRHVLNAPVDPGSAGTVSVDISPGLGARAIARRLHDAGVLRSPAGFSLQVLLRGARDDLKAGVYAMSARESGFKILARLREGDTVPQDVSITFPEGFTEKQIAARLGANGLAGDDAFLSAATSERFREEFPFLGSAPKEATLEGYLFPDTYRFARDASPEDVTRRMLQRFAEQWEATKAMACGDETGDPLVADSAARCPLLGAQSVHALVTVASIVEREVRSSEDRRRVSGILWKRLKAGVGLEADATVRYVTGDWERPLSASDLAVDSPYNTRRYRGLPPGPIGNPGRMSLQAALNPEESEYFFYLSAPSGETIFSRTLEEHNAAKARYLR